MKCKIPEISWHNRDPVLSVDIQPKSSDNIYRLCSGGTDAHVLIWYMKLTSGDHGDIELDLAADLTRHQRAVNVVKWSPSGELLASGDDESVVFIWKQKSDSEPINILDPSNDQDKEVWITLKVLRGHMEDIYDLSWSPNSQFLVSGSVDNSAMVWDVQKGKSLAILNDHKGFVQGVAWDPKNQYIATLSTDRYLRIFDIQSKKVLYRVRKGTLPVPEGNDLHGKTMHLFHDDTLQTFFRRLSFTPDGKLLLTPSGLTDYDGCTHPLHTTYVFSRFNFRQPAIVLPCPEQYTVAVRCSPLLYRLRPYDEEKNPPVVPLPYRMIFAVATKSSVYFYDTQQKQPFALISNIHYTRLTDITWSNDGRVVVVSSTDGFCSLITFDEGELGEVYEDTDAVLEAALAQVIGKTTKSKKSKDSDGRNRKSSVDDSNEAKVTATTSSKEPSLEKIEEGKPETNGKKDKDEEKVDKSNSTESAAKNVDNDETPKATPIAIKRKPGPNDISKATPTEKNNDKSQATPIAIKRKPGPTEASVDTTTEKKTDKTQATPIAIKRKPSSSAETPQTKTENQATPIAVKRKPSSSETPQNKTDKEATPIAIKRKPSTNETPSDKSNKEATPIAIKRKPSTSETPQNKSDKEATPIAIKRKPGAVETQTDKEKKSESKDKQKPTPIAIKHKPGPVDENAKEKPATPIAIKRKPGPVGTPKEDKNKATDDAEEKTPPKASKPVIILDKEILSSEEKFESPEKKSRPVTPISVRRHPRTPSTGTQVSQSPTTFAKAINAAAAASSSSADDKPAKTPIREKKANPISVRRTPRNSISVPPPVNTPTLVEEAMDAWPLTKEESNPPPSKNSTDTKTKKISTKEEGIKPLPPGDETCDRTEDICLVYEETVEEAPEQMAVTKAAAADESTGTENAIKSESKNENSSKAPPPVTPSNKTPRRVALKTISTPKSKKKLLD
ncbi:chromatin assembly factor 1 subunit B [Musca vetustissima]|uniref:chromatin assembly factor 1 subunit B n=1 Tax=Musca vetustissima TaxID=27455 RepID=UPI002AB77E0C|nr:chromatin assembly factor 1 subunit B [Musca vetustissima]